MSWSLPLPNMLSQASQEVNLLTVPGKEEEKSSSSSEEEELSDIDNEEEAEAEPEEAESIFDKADIGDVLKVNKIQENIKSDVDIMIETQKVSKWSSIRYSVTSI